MSLLWAGCLLDSTAPCSCGTETFAEVRTSRPVSSLGLFRKSVKLKTSRVPSVLMDLRKMFHAGPSQASETVCEEQEQSNLLDSTPTPTSLEVREYWLKLIVGSIKWLRLTSIIVLVGPFSWQCGGSRRGRAWRRIQRCYWSKGITKMI